jgi:hypothetical protein
MQPTQTPSWWNKNLEVADLTVDVSRLDASLAGFLVAAAEMHEEMFAETLTITSGNDGNHAADSKHYSWKAVDIRSRDIGEADADRFASAMVSLQSVYKVGIFDERFIGAPHWHVETF